MKQAKRNWKPEIMNDTFSVINEIAYGRPLPWSGKYLSSSWLLQNFAELLLYLA